MNAHGSKESGLNWSDGYIPYDQLITVLTEITANFDLLCAYGSQKCEILSTQLIKPIHNYEDLQCPYPSKPKSDFLC